MQKKRAGPLLHDAARAVLADARHALADTSRDTAATVHELRVALKRWRAVARLLGPCLAPPHGAAVDRTRQQARNIARRLAQARDAQAAADALADLGKDGSKLSATTAKEIAGRLENLRRAVEKPTALDRARSALARWIDATANACESWPCEQLTKKDLAAEATRCYRRARGRVPRSWPAADADDLHRLRRRVVEHHHQMELFTRVAPRFAVRSLRDLRRLRNRLGAHHDLQVLAALTMRGRPLAPWRAQLGPLIAGRQAEHRAAAQRLCRRLFADKAEAFRRELK